MLGVRGTGEGPARQTCLLCTVLPGRAGMEGCSLQVMAHKWLMSVWGVGWETEGKACALSGYF